MTSKVRVLLPPPAFAREASEGCRAEAHLGEGGLCTRATARQAAPKPTWAKAGCVRELRLGKPRRSPLGEGGRCCRELRLGKPCCDHQRERQPQARRGSRFQLKYRKQPHAK